MSLRLIKVAAEAVEKSCADYAIDLWGIPCTDERNADFYMTGRDTATDLFVNVTEWLTNHPAKTDRPRWWVLLNHGMGN